MSQETEVNQVEDLTPIDLGDGVKRNLCFTLDKLEEIKAKYGSWNAVMSDEQVYSLPWLLHAGLVDSDLTIEQIKKKIHIKKVYELGLIVYSAITGITLDRLKEARKLAEQEAKDPNATLESITETGSNPSTSGTSGASGTTPSA